jgi:DNA-directed RNA polymerase III subunit RPC1
MKKIIDVLNCVCKDCSRILLPEIERRAAVKSVRKPGLDSLRKKAICKNISTTCKKCKICPYCGAFNGPVKKVGGHPVKMIHHKFAVYTSSNAKSKVKPAEMLAFEASFDEARKSSNDVERHWRKAVDDMHPLKVLSIFRNIPDVDVELLGMDPHSSTTVGGNGDRPEHMIWTSLPAPPVTIRPSVAQESASTEDDITNKLGDIIQMNNLLQATLKRGQPLSKIMELWEFVQIQVAMYIDGNLPGLGRDGQYGRVMRGFCQRLKGKQGRFRGNLSGKRVDFSGRTVISPDPNLAIDEVAVPSRVAMTMTYPEKVNRYNIQKLRDCVRRGDKIHPGANFIVKGADGRRIVLRMVMQKGDLERMASKLEIGDTVERHLADGDVVLFNRQPSLHKLSILSHRVKVRPWRTFRLNECVCNPYNADFDGDEMNLHVPQTEEARMEAHILMNVGQNLATPKNGTPIIAAIQDFITAAYLLSQKDRFFSRAQFTQVVSYMFGGMVVTDPITKELRNVTIPPPAILRPRRLWTGKQVWNVLMRPYADCEVKVNLEAKGKQFDQPKPSDVYSPTWIEEKAVTGDIAPDMDLKDSYLVVRNSEVMCGTLDKASIGDGKKDSIFYVMLRDFGAEYAVEGMNRLARLAARWLGEQGFSIGLVDVYPSTLLSLEKDKLVKDAYDECTALIRTAREGKLATNPGCSAEVTLEAKLSGILSKVRRMCGDACMEELSKYNAPLIMAKCGSKGSNLNVSQMVAAVGQQIIDGERVQEGFESRTLPHFKKGSREPEAKGFVVNSFFSGLNPTEFIFHAMSGREGLVDTAVKTAETGYMSRRLMKSLEDLSVKYDGTVRESGDGVVQYVFGDDGLDPAAMEGGSGKPIDFVRLWSHSIQSTWDQSERGLTQLEIQETVVVALKSEKAKLIRRHETGSQLEYDDKSDKSLDHLESTRIFLRHIEEFVAARAEELKSNQARLAGSEEKIFKLTATALDTFLSLCWRKFSKSRVEPGHAVGAVSAQSIGEPGTQMTLKTFHFAGVAGMSLTQGVPRIKEIINASRNISTPLITCILESPYEEMAARFAKAAIQKTYLKDVVSYIEDVWHLDGYSINMRVDWKRVDKMGLKIHLHNVVYAIQNSKLLRGMAIDARPSGRSLIRVYIDNGDMFPDVAKKASGRRKKRTVQIPSEEIFATVQMVKRRLPNVVIDGYPDANRAVMTKADKKDETGKEPISVLVEGYGLKACMTTPGVLGVKTKTNSVIETFDVLGIEAARATIINEINEVMKGMDIDPRHMQLLADVMTYKGDVLGITRFGLAKMRDSVLQLASFEKTPDHLFEAAVSGKKDEIKGVSECIIMGQSVRLGTGSMSVYRPLPVEARAGDKDGEKESAGFRDSNGYGKEKRSKFKSMKSELLATE